MSKQLFWKSYTWKLLADVDPLCEATLLAQHVAAPVKPTVATFAARLLQDVVPAAAAQRAAAVRALAGLVADAPLRARRVRGRVRLAEIRRLLEIHQLSGQASTAPSAEPRRRASAGPVLCPGVENPTVLVLGVDEDGRRELVLQRRSNEPELWGHVPAGLELTAPRRAVTFALPRHVVGHHL